MEERIRELLEEEKSTHPFLKGKSNAVNPTTPTASTSAVPAMNIRAKAKGPPVVTIHMLQD